MSLMERLMVVETTSTDWKSVILAVELLAHMVRVAGLEPARANAQQILSLWCLPIPPRPHI